MVWVSVCARRILRFRSFEGLNLSLVFWLHLLGLFWVLLFSYSGIGFLVSGCVAFGWVDLLLGVPVS